MRVLKALLLTFLLLFLLVAAAGGPSTVQVANGLAVVVMALAPLLLKYIKLSGPQMVGVSYAAALVVAAVAGLVTGEYKPDLSSLPALLASSAGLWAVQQGIYQLFKDHPTAQPLLK